jgi:hypothetical protein
MILPFPADAKNWSVAMNPAKRARLLQIPAQLKQLASEALDILLSVA